MNEQSCGLWPFKRGRLKRGRLWGHKKAEDENLFQVKNKCNSTQYFPIKLDNNQLYVSFKPA